MSELSTAHSTTTHNLRNVIGSIFVLFLIFLIPILIAALLFYGARKLALGRIEGFVALVGGLVMLVAIHGAALGYFVWLLSLAGAEHSPFPWLSLLAYSITFSGLALIFQTNALVLRGIKSIRPKFASKATKSIIPSNTEGVVLASPPIEHLITPDVALRNPNASPKTARFILGVDTDNRPAGISYESLKASHMLVFGQTGVGKTETLKTLIGSVLDVGWDVTVLDLKDDIGAGGLRDWCRIYSRAHRLPYQEMSSSDLDSPFYFNPFTGIKADEAVELVVSTQVFPDAFWEAINKNQLSQACTLMWYANKAAPSMFPEPNIHALGRFLGNPKMTLEADKMVRTVLAVFQGKFTARDFIEVTNPSAKAAEAAQLFSHRIEKIYNTETGRALLRPDENKTNINVEQEGLTYIGLDSLGKADITRNISSTLLQRLNIVAAHRITASSRGDRITSDKGRLIVIDEANRVNREVIENMLSRVRGAGMRVVLSTQGPTDWTPKDGNAAGLDSLTNNCGVVLTMQQGNIANAELCADLLGKKMTINTSETIHYEGFSARQSGSTLSEHRDWIVSPDDLMRLGRGIAIIRVANPTYSISGIRIIRRDPTLVRKTV
jgi:hypothetical protein